MDTLKLYDVEYTDPTNFIYIMNNKQMEDYVTLIGDNWDYNGLLELYNEFFNQREIKCQNKGITSFPVYPNMKYFYGAGNRLTSFPTQPNMVYFSGDNNELTSFPIQPKMKEFSGEGNQLTSFLVQPKMIFFEGNNNQLMSFPIQPTMEIFFGIDNQLASFETQPKMKEFLGDNNQLSSFPIQPNMENFSARNNQLTSFPIQPNMKYFDGDNNRLTSFPIQPKMPNFNISKLLQTQKIVFKHLFNDINNIHNCDTSNINDDYLNILNKAFNTTFTKENICNEINSYFKGKDITKKIIIKKCHNDRTVLLTDLKDVPSLYFYNMKINNKIFCGDIRELSKMSSKNPWTNEPFSNADLTKMTKEMDKIKSIIKELDVDVDESEPIVIDSVETTIRKSMSRVLEKLRYPKNVENYVSSNESKLNEFVNVLKDELLISENDHLNIHKVTNINNKKLLISNVLNLRLNLEAEGISGYKVMLEETYNNIF